MTKVKKLGHYVDLDPELKFVLKNNLRANEEKKEAEVAKK